LFLLATPAFAATCNDITVTPDSVVLSESRINRVLTLRIENEGNDSFDLDDVRVEEDDSRIDITVDSFPDEIQENGSGNLVLRYTTQDVNGDQTTSFNVSLRGAFDNTPSCSLADLTFTIDVTIQDSADVCKAISFETTDVSVAEDVTIIHTVFLRNDSSEDFTLQGFNVFDDSPEFSTRLNPGFNDADFIKSIPRHTRQPVRIEIRTQRVSEDVVDHVFLETRGAFSNGQDCSFGDIDGAFEVTVENTFTNVFACTELRVLPAHFDVRAGENNTHSLFLQNNSDQTFHVDHFQIQDVNYQLDYSLLATPQTIRSTKTGEFSLQSTGFRNDVSFDGSAFITIQGHFTDTTACAIPNMRIPFTFHGTQGEQCADFKIILDGGLVKEGQTIPIELINPLTQTARVALTLEDGIIIPSVIAVPPLSHVIHAVRVETNSQVNTLHLQPLIEGCALEGEDRPLFFSSVTQAPIQLNNPPSEIVIGNASTFAIPLMNTSFYSHDATLTLTVKPTGQTF
ncbi:MAG: hypothetical protein U1C71_00315, partial [archaeon]|nr:hypothetical protein [archaeon]